MTNLQLPAYTEMVEETIGHWFDLCAELLKSEHAQPYVNVWLKRLIRRGTIETARVIEYAKGSSLADHALREIAAEGIDNDEKLSKTIGGYAAAALLKDRVKRGKGARTPTDNLLRDQCIAVVTSLAIERWGTTLDLTRGRSSKKASICSFISRVLVKRKIMVGEDRVLKIYRDLLDFLPVHRAALMSASNGRI